ncbi:hypothetical protein EW026_g4160 [Hermanssonia centrifuga]|uniref:DUF6533 domain-containing protein n=1 Tax=Hermanssonia centrifuga TaxID=98765 RepID=A0A4S4KIY2_9APHY|nr:hypothetical protein EW026_g4160 [Hermanssonia centrifuga]
MPGTPSNDIAVYLSRIRIVEYMLVASLTLTITDWMVCFSNEVELVWKSKWTTTKVLYLITRYLLIIELALTSNTFLAHIEPEHCYPGYSLATWLSLVGFSVAECKLVIFPEK